MPGFTRRRNVKTAKAIPVLVPVPTKKPVETISYLDKLPSELVELIVRELRESTTPIKKQASKPAKRPECRCKMTPAARRSKENFNLARAPLETYSDPAWPLACTSRYLRAVVFDNQTNRRIHLGYCQYARGLTESVPEVVRENVR